jgi:IS30 family transposase
MTGSSDQEAGRGFATFLPRASCQSSGLVRAGALGGDLLCGENHSYMVTPVKRASRFAMLLKVPSSDTATVVGALTRHIGRLPAELHRFLTCNRGREMAADKAFRLCIRRPL